MPGLCLNYIKIQTGRKKGLTVPCKLAGGKVAGFSMGQSLWGGDVPTVARFLSGLALGSCCSSTAMVMLYSLESKHIHLLWSFFRRELEPLGFCPRLGYLAF